MENRIKALEKEVADLKRQLDERLTRKQAVKVIAQFFSASANSVFEPEDSNGIHPSNVACVGNVKKKCCC